ncbi:ARM repeat superfamily protein [Perilla frutescens var. hirtella]|nr:ARM repeat superfamily protein [Perilla frutescens var. hirtella]
MGKCEGGGSVALERPLKLWSLIIDSVRCGGGGLQRKKVEAAKKRHHHPGSEKLSELLKQPEWWENEEEVRRKEQVLEELKNVARKLGSDSDSLMVEGAADVRRLTKDDPHARTTLALLGVIPPLVALLHSPLDPNFNPHNQIAALYALLNLAIANDANKAAIVKAGAIHKMLKLIQSPNCNEAIAEAVVANFLGLSALDSNKPIIGSSGAIPFLVETLKDNINRECSSSSGSSSSRSGSSSRDQAKQDSLRALYNLSISPSNVVVMLESSDVIPYMFSKLGDMDMSERILSILGNVVSVAEGRKTISSSVPDAFLILMDVFNWVDSPGCQEKATYILMVMAHKSYGDRQAMIEAGIVSSLLELTLLGSTLAQKRASRMLECLRVEKGKQVSAPLIQQQQNSGSLESERLDESSETMMMMMSQENKAVKQLVQQSLHSNMKRMVKRANLPANDFDFVPSHHLRSLTSSSTSKSLPF